MNTNLKKLIAALLSVFVLFTMQGLGLAESQSQIPKISFDRNTGMVFISGYTESPNSRVTIEILYPGKTVDDLKNAANNGSSINVDGLVRYFGETTSGEDMHWEINFIFGADTGVYPIRVRLITEEKEYTDNLNFVTTAQLKKIIEDINSVPTNTGKIVEENMEILGLRNDVYNDLLAASINFDDTYLEIGKEIPFDGIDSLKKSFEKNMLILGFNTLNSVNFEKYLNEYPNILGLENDIIYKDYLKLNKTARTDMANKLSIGTHKTTKDIANDFIEKGILYFLLNTTEWTRVATLAENYKKEYVTLCSCLKELKIDEFKTMNAELQYNVISELLECKSTVKDLQEWINKFNELYNKWRNYSPNEDNSSSNGPSSSHSTGVGNVSSAIPYKDTIKDPETNKVKTNFADLDNAPWAKDGIIALAEKGILSGKSQDFFDTSSDVTREEFIKILVSAFNLLSDDSFECSFADVSKKDWYYKYVSCAEMLGITSGQGNGDFGISKSITREEMSSMLKRTLDLCKINLPSANAKIDFTDAEDISDWASDAIEQLQLAGIVNGMEDGLFYPKNNTTRAQAAMIIYKTLSLI